MNKESEEALKQKTVYLSNTIVVTKNLVLPTRSVQPVAREQYTAQDGFECKPTQNHKFT